MKKILATALFLLSSVAIADGGWKLPIVKVIDGDTIETRFDSFPKELQRVYVRIRGVDTPESQNAHAKCQEEMKEGQVAKFALKDFVGNATEMEVSHVSWDKYGGRIDANVSINGVDVAQWLVDNHYAFWYNGGMKSNWCEILQQRAK
jgi:endonuclease YncB( thermonuclease family)